MFVPKDLSQDQLPFSFRYYDPLIRIIKDRINDDILENFKMRGQLEQKIHGKNQIKNGTKSAKETSCKH